MECKRVEKKPLRTSDEWEATLGADIRRLRVARRYTQNELAERANVSLSALKNLEAGRGSSLATVVRVARALERTEWLSSFAPAEPRFSPMELLRQSAAEHPRRVRHGASTS